MEGKAVEDIADRYLQLATADVSHRALRADGSRLEDLGTTLRNRRKGRYLGDTHRQKSIDGGPQLGLRQHQPAMIIGLGLRRTSGDGADRDERAPRAQNPLGLSLIHI